MNQVKSSAPLFCHVHLVSDSTGETLITVCRAVAARFSHIRVLEHIHPLIRNAQQLNDVIQAIDASPGVVLYTLVNHEMGDKLKDACHKASVPCQSILDPVVNLFGSYLGLEASLSIGGQHNLNSDYFRRIDALNFTLTHDDGYLSEEYEEADIVLVGISRTSKTPTSIYLANRGIRTANMPLVMDIDLPPSLFSLKNPLIVGLLASPERISQIRENRVLGLGQFDHESYVDRRFIAQELNYARRLFEKHKWPIIDVTRKSIEESAANILSLYYAHKEKKQSEQWG